MVASLETIQSLPEEHRLRSAKVLVEAAADYYMNSKDSAHQGGHRETKLFANGFDGERSASGFTLPNGVLFGKKADGFTLFDSGNSDVPGLKFRVTENAGRTSISVSSNSRNLTNNISNTAKEMLGALGFDDKTAAEMLKQAAITVQFVRGSHADRDTNVGAEIKKALDKRKIEENLATHMGERSFPIDYANALEEATKPVDLTKTVETEFFTRVETPAADGVASTVQITTKAGAIPVNKLPGMQAHLQKNFNIASEIKECSLVFDNVPADKQQILEEGLNRGGSMYKAARAAAQEQMQPQEQQQQQSRHLAGLEERTAQLAQQMGAGTREQSGPAHGLSVSKGRNGSDVPGRP